MGTTMQRLIARARSETLHYGYMCLDTAALLMEQGVDVQTLEDNLIITAITTNEDHATHGI
jgi:hypothetical protein